MSTIQKVIAGLFLVLVSIYSITEVIEEISDLNNEKESLWHVAFEIFFVLSSLIVLFYFLYIIYQQFISQARLEANLFKVTKNLENTNIKLQNIKKEFQKVIQCQFQEWQLTPSEEEVALLMLKGLSFKEVAEIRSTHEKTVRNHASSIYEKSGLAGRHELSAWFFEDLL